MGKLGIYLLSNYPSSERFLAAVSACEDSGVDFLEIGFPFSDPVADGEILERASQVTRERYTLDDFFVSLKRAKSLFTGRIYVMTYTNLLYAMGLSAFAKRADGISGLILADLPCREMMVFEKDRKDDAPGLIPFLTPESRENDIEIAAGVGGDFIYFISKRGITGGSFSLDGQTDRKIAAAKRTQGIPVFLGFGIRDRSDVARAWEVADGAIIGTEALRMLEQGTDRFRAFLRDLR